jgi:hypothetical protein
MATPREPKPEWVAALRALEGCADADIYFNALLHRWMFRMRGADGIFREQAWGWFRNPATGQEIKPDPVTGLRPFRELDDTAMGEAIRNLESSYLANRYDGAGTTRREVERRMRFNADLQQAKYDQLGGAFADMVYERARRIRGAAQVPVLIDLSPQRGKS